MAVRRKNLSYVPTKKASQQAPHGLHPGLLNDPSKLYQHFLQHSGGAYTNNLEKAAAHFQGNQDLMQVRAKMGAALRANPLPSVWTYNWNAPECSTANPTPREHHAHVWVLANGPDARETTLSIAFDHMVRLISNGLGGGMKIKRATSKKATAENSASDLNVVIVKKRKGKKKAKGELVIARGVIHGGDKGDGTQGTGKDPMFGTVMVLRCTTRLGYETLAKLCLKLNFGIWAFIAHDERRVSITEDIAVVVKTGEGPEKINDEVVGAFPRVATRFEMVSKKNEGAAVARCHLSYCDGSWDKSMGPTIEMMSVHQQVRGQGFLRYLWPIVRHFAETRWKMEVLNSQAPTGHIVIKATSLTGGEIDVTKHEKDTRKKLAISSRSITDKRFFFDFLGGQVWQRKGRVAELVSTMRPSDEEGALFVPLVPVPAWKPRTGILGKMDQLLRESVDKDMIFAAAEERYGLIAVPGVNGGYQLDWVKKVGLKQCEKCHQMETLEDRAAKTFKRCTRCKQAAYCSRKCQVDDWKSHKLWCNKTKSDFKEEMNMRDAGTSLVQSMMSELCRGGGGAGTRAQQQAAASFVQHPFDPFAAAAADGGGGGSSMAEEEEPLVVEEDSLD